MWQAGAILGVLLMFAACNREKTPGGSAAGAGVAVSMTSGSGSARVTWRPNVHVVEREAGLAAILAVSSDGTGMLLDSSISEMRSLKAGDVLVVKGFLAKRIIAAEVQGPWVAVVMQQAALTDAQSGILSHANAAIGGSIFLSALFEAVLAVPGVQAIADLSAAVNGVPLAPGSFALTAAEGAFLDFLPFDNR